MIQLKTVETHRIARIPETTSAYFPFTRAEPEGTGILMTRCLISAKSIDMKSGIVRVKRHLD